jgi:RecA/RadA recombinase
MRTAMLATHEDQIDALKHEVYLKESAHALLTEKEGEIRVLQTKNKHLDEEINSGTPSKKKIFYLAEEQAKQDQPYGSNYDSREGA